MFFGQSSNVLKHDAEKMGQAFISGNFADFTKYNHPKILKMMGGESKMQQTLHQIIEQYKTQGITFLSIQFGEPSKLTKLKNEWVGTINQTITMNTPEGKKTSSTKLLAFSYDNGKHWYFSDTSNKDLITIKKIFPEITSEILNN